MRISIIKISRMNLNNNMSYKKLILIILTLTIFSILYVIWFKKSDTATSGSAVEKQKFIDYKLYQVRLLSIFIPSDKESKEDRKHKKLLAEKYFSDIVNSKKFGKIFEINNKISQQNNNVKIFDLGWISQGKLPKNFDEKAFALKNVGEATMFETELGFHIVQLMNIRKSKDFNSVIHKKEETYKTTYQKRPYDNMIFIKGGSFWAGSTEAEIDMRLKLCNIYVGKHIGGCYRKWFEDEIYQYAEIQDLYIDKYEVSMGEYKKFISQTGHKQLPDWVYEYSPKDNYPVVGIDWYDANAYAKWAGKRLPTQFEWEYIARGKERRLFPWGNALPDGTRANYSDINDTNVWKDKSNNDGYKHTAPVGSYPKGQTPQGIFDMAGNVREWTSSVESGTDKAIVKGGSFSNAYDDLWCADYRINKKDTLEPNLGFRCVADIE
ncbi:MAG: SUMF1/EgtB/PvdO family nonheme iron enzyme [Endomicrobiaceae bacterium]|nr:SUMF1/EgtB/PvdO family nonheme iron enzyme [Endomicrobiaceae bacterium]